MQKTSVLIPGPNGKWGQYVSKFPPDSGRILPDMFTKDTRDIITAISGQADKRTGGTPYNLGHLLSGPILDQYEGIFLSQFRLLIVNDAGTLKGSPGDRQFYALTNGGGFTNPANFEFATAQSRVYGCNGIDNPIVIDTATSYGGVTYPVNQARVRQMGAFPPGAAPTVVLNVDSTTPQVPAGAHTYKITFVYYNGIEESNGGSASTPVTNDATHTSNTLSSIPIGGYGVTARNIYRDNNDGNWLLLDTLLDNTTTTYDDKLPIGATPTPIPTNHNTPPIFKYIAAYLDRLFVIDVTGKHISWSIPGEPDVFDPENEIDGPQDDIMTAIYVFNGVPWVFGQHTIGTIQGSTDNTFFYNPVSVTVGCVDNRSIQTRSIISVPTMIWLSGSPNRGLYYTNGSIVQYLSEFIEDLASNVSQTSFVSRNNTQNSLAAFQGDTSSSGIDLLSSPGTVQTIDPDVEFQTASDWLTGTLSNLVPVGDSLKVPTAFVPALADGVLGGDAQISGSNLVLPIAGSGFTGESETGPIAAATAVYTGLAYSFIPPVGGTLNTVSLFISPAIGNTSAMARVWTDSFGLPGAAIFSTPVTLTGGLITFSPSISLVGGTTYWIGIDNMASRVASYEFNNFSGGTTAAFAGFWVTPVSHSAPIGSQTNFYTYTQTPIPDSGTWTSPVFDSLSTTLTPGMLLDILASFPAGTSSSVVIKGSASSSGPFTVTDTLSSPNGSDISLTGGNFRYWQIVITISTTDNRITPSVGAPTLEFNNQGTWTSPAITCTSDITGLGALTDVSIVPGGTSIVLTIATSHDNITYTSFGPLGSATPDNFAKIRATLTADADDIISPTLEQMELDWLVTSTIISSIIDTGPVPSGWGNFQFSRLGSSGTIQFYFRTASTSGGIPGATFVALSNGQIPTNAVFEFCQWKAVLSATADNIPAFDSVTVNWLLSQGKNLRAASLFFDKSYYLAVANDPASTTNDTLIELDYEGNFRIHREQIGTMGLFFSDAYNGDANSGTVLNMFKVTTDNGTPIVFDLRTKCWNWANPQMGDNIHLKIVRSLKLKGVNTGTLFHVYYSVDRGVNWIEMLNSSGNFGYQTDASNTQFVEFFIPNFDGSVQISAPNLMFRVVSADAFPATVLTIEPTVYIRKGKFIKEEAVVWP